MIEKGATTRSDNAWTTINLESSENFLGAQITQPRVVAVVHVTIIIQVVSGEHQRKLGGVFDGDVGFEGTADAGFVCTGFEGAGSVVFESAVYYGFERAQPRNLVAGQRRVTRV